MTDADTAPTPDNVVAHYADGRVIKGHTADFSPDRSSFTMKPIGEGSDGSQVEIRLQDLKAVFFVRDFEGDSEYTEWKQFVEPRLGLKVALKFQDGEVMVGARLPVSATHGFFLFPADRSSNNEKVFVVNGAVRVIEQVPE